MTRYNWVFGYTDKNDAHSIKIYGGRWDSDALDSSYYLGKNYRYVSAVYPSCKKAELIKCIENDGWWYVNGERIDGVYPSKHIPKRSAKKSNNPLDIVDKAFAESKKKIRM